MCYGGESEIIYLQPTERLDHLITKISSMTGIPPPAMILRDKESAQLLSEADVEKLEDKAVLYVSKKRARESTEEQASPKRRKSESLAQPAPTEAEPSPKKTKVWSILDWFVNLF